MGSQIFGAISVDVQHQGQLLQLRVGQNHSVVSEVQMMKTRSLGTFKYKKK